MMNIVILDERNDLREKLKKAKSDFILKKEKADKDMKRIKHKKLKSLLIIALIYVLLNLTIGIALNFSTFDYLMYCTITLFLCIIISMSSGILNYKEEEMKVIKPLIEIKEYISKIKKALHLNESLLNSEIKKENSDILLKSSCFKSFTYIKDVTIDYIEIDCFKKTIKIPKNRN